MQWIQGYGLSNIIKESIEDKRKNHRAVQVSYAFVENVATHADYRGNGYAGECLDYARKIAEKENCYKMMLLTGSRKPETLRFYEKAGYNSSDKTAFIQWIGMDK